MSKLSTKNIKTETGGGIPKSIQPGNHLCKILSVGLEEFKFKENAYHIKLYLETSPLASDFEGFFIDKNNESLGRHKGQVGWVRASEWAFADGTTKGGVEVSRDQDIMKFIKTLCQSLGKKDWLVTQDEKHETIESLVAAFNAEAPFKDIFLEYCIGGKEYQNKQGYTQYDLFLPKFSKAGTPFQAKGTTPNKLIVFKESEHIRKSKVAPVTEFGNSETTLDDPKKDFSLD